MNYMEEYKKKCMTAENAAELIEDGKNLATSFGPSQPPAILKALADRIRAGFYKDIPFYYMHALEHLKNTLLQPDLLDIVHPHSFFLTKTDRELVKLQASTGKKMVDYIPNYFYQIPRLLTEFIGVDTFICTVSPMDNGGFFSLGLSNDYSTTAALSARQLIVEVNENMPRVYGQSHIHISEITAIVENTVPLIELPLREPTEKDKVIARKIIELIPNGATIQCGIGGVPNAVMEFLDGHQDLGVHTEHFNTGMMRLIQKGVITNRKKTLHPRKNVFTVAWGNQDLHRFVHENLSMESYPVSYINQPAVIAKNANLISINAILEVDLFGQVNAEFLGAHQFGGPGGQLDYIRGAFESNGGKSILAFYSTTQNNTISKIVPRLDNVLVTDPRMDTFYLATEFGICCLKGKSSRERALSIIELAHPQFKDELTQAAKKMGLI